MASAEPTEPDEVAEDAAPPDEAEDEGSGKVPDAGELIVPDRPSPSPSSDTDAPAPG